MKKRSILLLLLLTTLMLGWLYWFQIRPSNIKQRGLEEQIKTLQREVDNNLRLQNDAENINKLRKDIENLQYQIEDSTNKTKKYLEDERNNQGNCERNGGKYQGNGLCVYY